MNDTDFIENVSSLLEKKQVSKIERERYLSALSTVLKKMEESKSLEDLLSTKEDGQEMPIKSLREFSEKANREFAQNEEAQEALRKRFSSGFSCNRCCNEDCKYAKPHKRFHPITGEEYIKYTCSMQSNCCQ